MEDSITLPELDTLLGAIREDQRNQQIFLAGIQGIDLTKEMNNSVEDRRKEIERRAAQRRLGLEEAERQEFSDFDIAFDVVDIDES